MIAFSIASAARGCFAVLLVASLLTLAPLAEAKSKRRAKARATPVAAVVDAVDYSTRSEIREFIGQMVEKHQFDNDELMRVFSQVKHSDVIVRLMTPGTPGPSGVRRSWHNYRERVLDPLRQREGARFWREHEGAIRRAAEQYGVPEEIIVGIIGVETIYGRITGDFRVIDALSVLTFDYTRRAEFFRGELEQFLLFARENNLDMLNVRGSFAGAIGLPQFMPSSIRRYAVDFDGDGRIDLRRSATDAIGSVARFLAEHGWQRGQATHYSLRHDNEARLAPLIQAGVLPSFTRADLQEFGVVADAMMADDMKVALIDLPNAADPVSYYLGTMNFYAITRYNRSSFYAMSVIELGRVLREQRGAIAGATAGSIPTVVVPAAVISSPKLTTTATANDVVD
jgi:membrane-bound lytic murein transglycosylase B